MNSKGFWLEGFFSIDNQGFIMNL